MIFSKFLPLALALLLSATVALSAPPEPQTAEGILQFAEALAAQGESFRAVTEYQRVLFHFGEEAPLRQRALRGLGDAYARAGRWTEAASAYETLQKEAPAPQTRLRLGEAWYRAGRNAEAARLLLAPEASPEGRTLGTLAWLKAAEPGQAAPAEASADLLAAHQGVPRKSPALAGFLSAALPGAGQLYVGRPRDAATTALLNGLFLWGTVTAARRDERALAAALGTFEFLWYTGGIVGAVGGANEWNRREGQRFYEGWEAVAAPSLSLWSDGLGGLGLALSLPWR